MAKKPKGFGKKKKIPTRETREFIIAFKARTVEHGQDSEKVYELVEAKLDESSLEAFPLVFNQLIANQTSQERKSIAGLFNFLGSLLAQFPRGDCQLNLEISITVFQLALKVFIREVFPQDWASIQNNLANAYLYRIRGERAENLEKAIAGYELALQVYTPSAFPQDWAMTQNNLANAYLYRIRGERAENLETAIAGYELALQVYTRSAFPQDWAMTQGNLASVQLEQFELTQELKYFDEAISALQASLDVAIPKTDSYIYINYILGRALDHRYNLDRQPEDLEQAILSYHLAAENTPWESARADYLEKAGDSQYELGVALTQSGQWYKGLATLEASLKTYRQVDNRLARGDALQQMARTHYLMSNFDQAKMYFRDALRLYLAEKNTIGEAHCRAGLGRLFLRLNYVEDALQELEQACELYHQLEDETRLKEIQNVYQLARKVKEKQPL
ncbi:MAG: tetratricopeptide repeat protein [Cyanobacteria bacterium P01_E01_bin.42]